MAARTLRVGLVVRSGPFCGRSGRDQLDLALSAMTLGFEVELFFVGAGILQLLPDAKPEAAGLPPGIHGWASLPELGAVKAWVPEKQRRITRGVADSLALEIAFLPGADLSARLDQCDQVLVS